MKRRYAERKTYCRHSTQKVELDVQPSVVRAHVIDRPIALYEIDNRLMYVRLGSNTNVLLIYIGMIKYLLQSLGEYRSILCYSCPCLL